jgi:hypothetical protein
LSNNYSFIDKLKITRIKISKKDSGSGASGGSGASIEGATYSENQKTPKSGNNCNTGCENTQENGRKVADITNETDVKTSEHSHKAPKAPKAPQPTKTKADDPTMEKEPTPGTGRDMASGISPNEDEEVKTDETPMFRKMPEMLEEIKDDTPVVTEEELLNQESLKSKSEKHIARSPIVSVEDFFNNNISLPNHSFEESPCYPIIGIRSDETSTIPVYYCESHPDLGSTFFTLIEIHCQKEPGVHKAAILAKENSAGESA